MKIIRRVPYDPNMAALFQRCGLCGVPMFKAEEEDGVGYTTCANDDSGAAWDVLLAGHVIDKLQVGIGEL